MQRMYAATIMTVALISVAHAAPALKPGQWEYTIKTEMAGMPFAAKPIISHQCLTKKDIDEGKYAQQNNPGGCEVQNKQESDSKVSYDMICAGPPVIKGHYEFQVSSDAMQGQGVMNMGQGLQATMDMTGKRLGDCK